MVWDIIFILAGALTWYIAKKKFDIELKSVKGIGIVLVVFVVLEIIKYLITTML